MANSLYTKAKEGLLEGLFDLTDNTIKLAFVKSSYSVNLSTHEFLSDIDEAHIAATSSSLSGKTTSSGIFDADNINVENYGTSGFAYIVLYKDTGVRSTSRLIAYIDTATGLPAPATSEVISITVNWSNDVYKIFSL
jgi:hypothetical protein